MAPPSSDDVSQEKPDISPQEDDAGRTPTEAKKLSLGLLIWIFVAARAALALFTLLRN